MPETVLVTGASGFIGAALCRALLDQGHPVRAFHRPSSDLRALAGMQVVLLPGDILDPDSLLPAMRGAEWVFHAAAESAYWRHPEQVISAGISGTRNVVRAALAAGVQRLIMTSSLAALGVPTGEERLDERHVFNLPAERFPYGFAKHRAEQEAIALAEGKLEVVILNPSAVFGAGDRKPISGSLVVEAARGHGFVYVDGGWNVVHIDDVVRGHLAAARRGRPGERYLLGGENLSHRKTLEIIAQVVGSRAPWLRIPGWSVGALAWLVDRLRPVARLPLDGNQLRLSRYRLYCDLTKSQRELGLPDPIPFQQAVQEFWAWYQGQRAP